VSNDGMVVIESDDYRKNREALAADPIIIAMAHELHRGINNGEVTRAKFVSDDGEPNFGFMQMVNKTYHARGGQQNETIGAAAKALLVVLDGLTLNPPDLGHPKYGR
jgi:hypothetical protein